MAKQVPTRFTQWEFTEKEAYVATRFSDLNIMLIQTLIGHAANRKLNLKYDPEKPLEFAQQEAEIQGEIGAYEHLLMLYSDTQVPSATTQDQAADVSRQAQSPQSKPA